MDSESAFLNDMIRELQRVEPTKAVAVMQELQMAVRYCAELYECFVRLGLIEKKE